MFEKRCGNYLSIYSLNTTSCGRLFSAVIDKLLSDPGDIGPMPILYIRKKALLKVIFSEPDFKYNIFFFYLQSGSKDQN